MGKIFIAQKGLVLDKTKSKILVIKYDNCPYLPNKINGKLGLPGGQMDFGEDPDKSFIREVEEETGVTISPSIPFHIYTWTYKKEGAMKQIVAVARLAFYKSGKPIKGIIHEKETDIEEVKWIKLKDIEIKNFVSDEHPVIKNFLKYTKQNLFK
jgi:ADP-ribose pyrophosphatase YjhB (NUDIX family)